MKVCNMLPSCAVNCMLRATTLGLFGPLLLAQAASSTRTPPNSPPLNQTTSSTRGVGKEGDCQEVDKLPTKAFEPSGLSLRPSDGTLWAIDDNGFLAVYDSASMALMYDQIATGLDDLEGLTFGPDTDMVYLAQEFPPTIFEFNVVHRALTGRSV